MCTSIIFGPTWFLYAIYRHSNISPFRGYVGFLCLLQDFLFIIVLSTLTVTQHGMGSAGCEYLGLLPPIPALKTRLLRPPTGGGPPASQERPCLGPACAVTGGLSFACLVHPRQVWPRERCSAPPSLLPEGAGQPHTCTPGRLFSRCSL